MPSLKQLIEIINYNDLRDIWRTFHSDQKQYTWVHSYNNVLSLTGFMVININSVYLSRVL